MIRTRTTNSGKPQRAMNRRNGPLSPNQVCVRLRATAPEIGWVIEPVIVVLAAATAPAAPAVPGASVSAPWSPLPELPLAGTGAPPPVPVPPPVPAPVIDGSLGRWAPPVGRSPDGSIGLTARV